MHGYQKITLTNESVREALSDYLQKHMAPGVVIVEVGWVLTPNSYTPGEQTVDVSFTQEQGSV